MQEVEKGQKLNFNESTGSLLGDKICHFSKNN